MWHKVFPGDEVVFSAARENAISEMLNKFPGIRKTRPPKLLRNNIILDCFSEYDIEYGQAVKIGIYLNENLAVVIQPYPGPNDLVGITRAPCAAKTIEEVIVFGVAEAQVTIEDKNHLFATLKNGDLVSCEEQTFCRILTTAKETGKQLCTVFLGTPPPTASAEKEVYTDFAVTLKEDNTLSITGGYLNRNGTLLKVEGKNLIPPKNGTLCLRSVLETKDETSQWTKPEFVFCDVACNAWPVADVIVKENEDGTRTITVRQRITNVAIILQTKPCPLTTVGAL